MIIKRLPVDVVLRLVGGVFAFAIVLTYIFYKAAALDYEYPWHRYRP